MSVCASVSFNTPHSGLDLMYRLTFKQTVAYGEDIGDHPEPLPDSDGEDTPGLSVIVERDCVCLVDAGLSAMLSCMPYFLFLMCSIDSRSWWHRSSHADFQRSADNCDVIFRRHCSYSPTGRAAKEQWPGFTADSRRMHCSRNPWCSVQFRR